MNSKDNELRNEQVAETFLLEEFMPFQFSVVANRVSQSIARVISRKFDLQIPEWRILTVLQKFSPCSALFLAEKTAMDPARVSRAQQRLSDLRLLTARQDPQDKRRLIVDLTPKGREIALALQPDAMAIERELLGCLTDAEKRALETIMSKLFNETEHLLK